MPIEEQLALVGYYIMSFAVCILATAVLAILRLLAKRNNSRKSTLKLISWILVLPTVVWIAYFSLTFHDAVVMIALDGEMDLYAEDVYKSSFDVTLDEAVIMAVDGGQSPNVRFYASCRIADLLLTNDEHTRAVVLEKVADAPEIRPGFFSTNQITSGFFTPNYPEGPFTVSEIVTKRLQINEAAAAHRNKP